MHSARLFVAASVFALAFGCRRAPKTESPSSHLAFVKGTLTWDDLEAIGDRVRAVEHAVPLSSTRMEAVSEEMIWTTKVTGTLPEYFVMRDWPMAHGAVFSASDVGGKAPVAVLGDKVATNLFAAGVDPVGQTIRLRKIAFTVIGVTAHKGLARSGLDQDDVVFVPATTFRARLQPGNPKALAGIIMFSSPRLDDAMTSVESLLRDRHLLGPEMDDDFEIGRFEE